MTEEEVAKTLAEEIRTNGGLRRSLGMVEGAGSGQIELGGTAGGLFIETAEGQTFAIGIDEVEGE